MVPRGLEASFGGGKTFMAWWNRLVACSEKKYKVHGSALLLMAGELSAVFHGEGRLSGGGMPGAFRQPAYFLLLR